MKFPPLATYTSNSYRIPVADLTTYSVPITHRSLPGRGNEQGSYHFLSGGFHKDRFFGHFATFSRFTTEKDEEGTNTVEVSRLEEGFSTTHHHEEFPAFWRNAERKNGVTNKPYGYAHHFATIGSSTDPSNGLRGIFSRNGRAASLYSASYETIQDLRERNSSGGYKTEDYSGPERLLKGFRTPFHPKYNVYTQRHDYPRAIYGNGVYDFEITDKNGNLLNPLSKSNQLAGRAGFKFSVFRHYGSSSSREGTDAIKLVIPASPAINPKAIAQGGWGHDYLVNNDTPISRRNWQSTLDTIQVYSPYGDAVLLDFLNGKRYSEKLNKSSIWSK